MKIFLSWSGKTSHSVALALRDWLPFMFNSIELFVSSEDIDKGSRGIPEIGGELEACNYGILCVTKENIGAPWLNFEAGALSKLFDSSRVAPFLFHLKRSDIPANSPLTQFQSTLYKQDDFRKLVHGINNALGETERSKEDRLDIVFDKFWPDLHEQLDVIPEAKDAEIPTPPKTEEILEELLQLARSQHRLLNSPDELLPESYLRMATSYSGGKANVRSFFQAQSYLKVTRDQIKNLVEETRELEVDDSIRERLIHRLQAIDNFAQLILEKPLPKGGTMSTPSNIVSVNWQGGKDAEMTE